MQFIKRALQSMKFRIKRAKQNRLKHKLSDKLAPVIREFEGLEAEREERNEVSSLFPVWVCWWQGEEKMPELVKCCYNSLKRNANGHPVHLITQENYQDYVLIPDYIIQKKESGAISITHFSDILRMHLLYEHGGLWVDSTILVTSPLPESLAGDFFSIRHAKNGQHVTGYRWTSFLIYAVKGNILIKFFKTCFLDYWKKEEKVITYLMMDYFFAIAYDRIPAVTRMVDKIPYNNLQHNELRYLMKSGKPFDKNKFEAICSDTYLHKLTWKKEFAHKTKDGRPTYYAYLLEQYG